MSFLGRAALGFQGCTVEFINRTLKRRKKNEMEKVSRKAGRNSQKGAVAKKRRKREREKLARELRYKELQAGKYHRIGEPLYHLDRAETIRLNRYRKRVGQPTFDLPTDVLPKNSRRTKQVGYRDVPRSRAR